MAKKRKKFLGLFGFGDNEKKAKFSPDAMGAIRAARKGQCKLAMKHLYDASPHNQSRDVEAHHREDHRIASIIVTQHCGKDKSKRGRKYGGGEYSIKKGIYGNKYTSGAFSGVGSRKRRTKKRK